MSIKQLLKGNCVNFKWQKQPQSSGKSAQHLVFSLNKCCGSFCNNKIKFTFCIFVSIKCRELKGVTVKVSAASFPKHAGLCVGVVCNNALFLYTSGSTQCLILWRMNHYGSCRSGNDLLIYVLGYFFFTCAIQRTNLRNCTNICLYFDLEFIWLCTISLTLCYHQILDIFCDLVMDPHSKKYSSFVGTYRAAGAGKFNIDSLTTWRHSSAKCLWAGMYGFQMVV